MRCCIATLLLIALSYSGNAQTKPHDISSTQLQAVIGLPLDQAVKQREQYKMPLRAAYKRQIDLSDKDCSSVQGQQPYNICMGNAGVQADNDFAAFYNNLQMLCHTQDQLATLQASEKAWELYEQSTMQATHASWPDGTGAPGFAGEVYLSLLRDRMRELYEIYGLNISQ
ncbi:MAG TPA: lysozyme inhibitor LprI family protein [Candidatus Aquilonibacter sp.]|nr:lysozyme inhibitor LprI family protein [Candidatus Aquilonibacter sp.]